MKTKFFVAFFLFYLTSSAQVLKWNVTHKIPENDFVSYAGSLNNKHYCLLTAGNPSKSQFVEFSEDLTSFKAHNEVPFTRNAFVVNGKIWGVYFIDKKVKREISTTIKVKNIDATGAFIDETDLLEINQKDKPKTGVDFGVQVFLSKNNKYVGLHHNKKFMVYETVNFELLKTYVIKNFNPANPYDSNLDFYLLDNGNVITIQKEKLPVSTTLYQLNSEIENTILFGFKKEKSNFNLYSKVSEDGNSLFLGVLNGKKKGNLKSLKNDDNLLTEGFMGYKVDIPSFSKADSFSVTINEEIKKATGKNDGIEFLAINNIYHNEREYIVITEKTIIRSSDKGNSYIGENLILFKIVPEKEPVQKIIEKVQYRENGIGSIYRNGELFVFFNFGKVSSTDFKFVKLDKELEVKNMVIEDSYKKHKMFLTPNVVHQISEKKYLIFGRYANFMGSLTIDF